MAAALRGNPKFGFPSRKPGKSIKFDPETEQAWYRTADRSFRIIAIPAFLLCSLFLVDIFLNLKQEDTTITDLRLDEESQLPITISTEAGSFYPSLTSKDLPLNPGETIVVSRSPIFHIIKKYGIEQAQHEVAQSFYEYGFIAILIIIGNLVTLLSSSLDSRLFAGGLSLIGLLILFIAYAVLG